jgi:hypothetical protein
MKRVTCSGLLSLKKDGALEIVDESSEHSVRLVRFNEFVPMNLPNVARYLTYRLAGRLQGAIGDSCADHTLSANDSRFDRFPGPH